MNLQGRNLLFLSFGALALLLIAPPFLDDYNKFLLTEMLIWGLYALGFDIIFGYTGLLNFGMSSFIGFGTYGVVLSVLHLQAGLWTALAVTIAVSFLFSCIYGYFVTRFGSHYFVVFTIVISMIFFYIAMNMRAVTGGDEGLTFSVPSLSLGVLNLSLKDPLIIYYFVLAVSVIVLFVVWRIFQAPLGKAIIAVRENEVRANALGYNTATLKLIAFTLSGMVSGVAGGLLALHSGYTSAHVFFWLLTAKAVIYTIVGGLGTLIGPFIGAGVLVYAEDLISTWNADIYPIIVGLILILVILTAPRGIVGFIAKLLKRPS